MIATSAQAASQSLVAPRSSTPPAAQFFGPNGGNGILRCRRR